MVLKYFFPFLLTWLLLTSCSQREITGLKMLSHYPEEKLVALQFKEGEEMSLGVYDIASEKFYNVEDFKDHINSPYYTGGSSSYVEMKLAQAFRDLKNGHAVDVSGSSDGLKKLINAYEMSYRDSLIENKANGLYHLYLEDIKPTEQLLLTNLPLPNIDSIIDPSSLDWSNTGSSFKDFTRMAAQRLGGKSFVELKGVNLFNPLKDYQTGLWKISWNDGREFVLTGDFLKIRHYYDNYRIGTHGFIGEDPAEDLASNLRSKYDEFKPAIVSRARNLINAHDQHFLSLLDYMNDRARSTTLDKKSMLLSKQEIPEFYLVEWNNPLQTASKAKIIISRKQLTIETANFLNTFNYIYLKDIEAILVYDEDILEPIARINLRSPSYDQPYMTWMNYNRARVYGFEPSQDLRLFNLDAYHSSDRLESGYYNNKIFKVGV